MTHPDHEMLTTVEPVPAVTYEVPVEARLYVHLEDREGTVLMASERDLLRFGYRPRNWHHMTLSSALLTSVLGEGTVNIDLNDLRLLPFIRLSEFVAAGMDGDEIPRHLRDQVALIEGCLKAHLDAYIESQADGEPSPA